MNTDMYSVYMFIFKLFFTSLFISLLLPINSHAQISITEIMYDPAGADTKREWIEVFNEGTSDIDLTTWFFFENNVFHKITAYAQSILKAGEYAIIADSFTDFLLDYVGFTGLLFDSAFSLNNTGEPLAMTNNAKETIDAFTYTSDMGAKNDGNSLQINNGLAISALPTPGASNSTQPQSPQATSSATSTNTSSNSSTNTNNTNTSTHIQQTPLSIYLPTIPFKVGIGRNRIVPINTPLMFEVEVSETKSSLSYEWSFGDIQNKKGKKVEHIYDFAGMYNVVLTAKDKESGREVVSRSVVEVIQPDIVVEQKESTVTLTNTSDSEINIGGFIVEYVGRTIIVPQNTIIGAGKTITLGKSPYDAFVSLKYPTKDIYYNEDDTAFVRNAFVYCTLNSHDTGCTQGHIAKLFDILIR
jgi:hypothetical protein